MVCVVLVLAVAGLALLGESAGRSRRPTSEGDDSPGARAPRRPTGHRGAGGVGDQDHRAAHRGAPGVHQRPGQRRCRWDSTSSATRPTNRPSRSIPSTRTGWPSAGASSTRSRRTSARPGGAGATIAAQAGPSRGSSPRECSGRIRSSMPMPTAASTTTASRTPCSAISSSPTTAARPGPARDRRSAATSSGSPSTGPMAPVAAISTRVGAPPGIRGATRVFIRSTDGGANFSEPVELSPAPIWGTLTIDPDGGLYLAGNANFNYNIFVVYRSLDAWDSGVDPTFDCLHLSISVVARQRAPDPTRWAARPGLDRGQPLRRPRPGRSLCRGVGRSSGRRSAGCSLRPLDGPGRDLESADPRQHR